MTDYGYGHESLEDKILLQNVPGRLHTWDHDADEVAGTGRAEWHDADAHRDRPDHDDDDVDPAPVEEALPHKDYQVATARAHAPQTRAPGTRA